MQIVDLTDPERYTSLSGPIAQIISGAKQMRREGLARNQLSDIFQMEESKAKRDALATFATEPLDVGSKSGLGGIMDAFNPFTPAQTGRSQLQDLIMGSIIQEEFRTISGSQLMAAEKWRQYQVARAMGDDDRADDLLSSSLVNINVPDPFRPKEVGEQGEGITARLDAARVTKRGTRHNKQSLLKGWNQYKRLSGYSNWTLKDGVTPDIPKKSQVWENLLIDIEKRRKEGELVTGAFDPKDPDWIKASELQQRPSRKPSTKSSLGGGGATGRFGSPISPHPALASIWPKLSSQQRQQVFNAFQNGYTVAEIKEALKVEGVK